jgi:hypothetical protein
MAQCFLLNLPSWIQALAAVSIVYLTVRTLLVLRDYAADTKRIARAGVTQIENSQMPFLALAMSYNLQGLAAGWVIANQGSGPAINVKFSHIQSGSGVLSIPPIAAKEASEVYPAVGNAATAHEAIQIDYESLSGSKYLTVIRWEGAMMQTQFQGPANR